MATPSQKFTQCETGGDLPSFLLLNCLLPTAQHFAQRFSLLSPSVGGHSIFNLHGRLGVQGRRGGGRGRERAQEVAVGGIGDLCYEVQQKESFRLQTHNSTHIKQLWECTEKLCVCLPASKMSPISMTIYLLLHHRHRHQTNMFHITFISIMTCSGALLLNCKPSPSTEADFQGESQLKRVI